MCMNCCLRAFFSSQCFFCHLNLRISACAYNEAYFNVFMVVTVDVEGSIKFFFDLGNKRWHAAKLQETLVRVNKCHFTPEVNPAKENRFGCKRIRYTKQKANHRNILNSQLMSSFIVVSVIWNTLRRIYTYIWHPKQVWLHEFCSK